MTKTLLLLSTGIVIAALVLMCLFPRYRGLIAEAVIISPIPPVP